MRRPRGLRPEDEDIWRKVVQSVTPMHSHPARPLLLPDEPPVREKAKPVSPRIERFRVGEKASRDHVSLPPSAAAPIQMDAKDFKRMSRGKLQPESRIDLHGMTLAEAHPALNGFIIGAHAAGFRLVLVITGKGKSGDDTGPIPRRAGVLKHQVPHWLSTAPLGPLILQVAEAHLKHGGGGAFYVYLRRQRG
jgi:DNA-nicking Smr family endonuclease